MDLLRWVTPLVFGWIGRVALKAWFKYWLWYLGGKGGVGKSRTNNPKWIYSDPCAIQVRPQHPVPSLFSSPLAESPFSSSYVFCSIMLAYLLIPYLHLPWHSPPIRPITFPMPFHKSSARTLPKSTGSTTCTRWKLTPTEVCRRWSNLVSLNSPRKKEGWEGRWSVGESWSGADYIEL